MRETVQNCLRSCVGKHQLWQYRFTRVAATAEERNLRPNTWVPPEERCIRGPLRTPRRLFRRLRPSMQPIACHHPASVVAACSWCRLLGLHAGALCKVVKAWRPLEGLYRQIMKNCLTLPFTSGAHRTTDRAHRGVLPVKETKHPHQ